MTLPVSQETEFTATANVYCFRDWHRAVVRQAGCGEISASFPVTLAQNHPDARITITSNVAEAAY